MRTATTFAIATALVATSAHAAYRNSIDQETGCWDGRDQYGDMCVTGTSEWNNGAFILILTNNCRNRVYATFCNEIRNSSSHDCGSSGIAGYATKRWRTTRDPTGDASWANIGSVKPNSDWVCNRGRTTARDLERRF